MPPPAALEEEGGQKEEEEEWLDILGSGQLKKKVGSLIHLGTHNEVSHNVWAYQFGISCHLFSIRITYVILTVWN